MKRYSFQLKKTFIDSTSAKDALEAMVRENHLTITEGEIPQKVKLYCSVTKTPNPSGQFSASAKLMDKNGNLELVASVDAPSPERALFALGLQNPQAHTCHVYRRRFGNEWELILGDPPATKKIA